MKSILDSINRDVYSFSVKSLCFCLLFLFSCKKQESDISPFRIPKSLQLPLADKLAEVDYFGEYATISLDQYGTIRINGTVLSEGRSISFKDELPVILAFDMRSTPQDFQGLLSTLLRSGVLDVNIVAIDDHFNQQVLINARLDSNENVKKPPSKKAAPFLISLNDSIVVKGEELTLDKLSDEIIIASNEDHNLGVRIECKYTTPELLVKVINLARRANIKRIALSPINLK